jgi:hypothetical protein
MISEDLYSNGDIPYFAGPEPRFVLQHSGTGSSGTERKLKTPSDWFAAKYPTLTEDYGPAFLEHHSLDSDGLLHVNPVEINVDLFAAVIGGTDEQSRVVYYLPEHEFYAFDRAAQHFKTITEAKLKFGLSQELIHCASYMSQNRARVEIGNIFTKFRSGDVLDAILERAKGLLAVDQSFFAEGSGNRKDPKKLTGEQTARIFAVEALESKAGVLLKIADAYERYVAFCQAKQMPVVLPRNDFRSPMVVAVRDTHGMGLSKDLRIDGKWTSGWRNLDAKVLAA